MLLLTQLLYQKLAVQTKSEWQANTHNLTVVSYNLHGFNQGISLLTSSCSKGGDFCSGTLIGAVRLASVVQLV